MRQTRNSAQVAVIALVLAVLTVGVWWAFLGWDTQKDLDPATGDLTGPYQVWQVIGCVAVLVVIVVAGSLLIPAVVVVPVVSLAFTGAWVVGAQLHEDSGLWAVGAVLVLVGTLAGGAVVGGLTHRLRRSGATLD